MILKIFILFIFLFTTILATTIELIEAIVAAIAIALTIIITVFITGLSCIYHLFKRIIDYIFFLLSKRINNYRR